ncbi:REEP4 protein, partial [Orthonyx spaldingii]|nr:REEP4 protein [Orthonyx spaldingii]
VRWMMYWIVFALFMATETFTDLLIACPWVEVTMSKHMPMSWEVTMLRDALEVPQATTPAPAAPFVSQDIDAFLVRARERGYETALRFGKRGLNLAATAAVQAATKSQGALAGRLRSFSMQDLRSLPEQ